MTKSDKLCVVLDFGGTKTATNGTFTIAFPDPSTPANAIISMSLRKKLNGFSNK